MLRRDNSHKPVFDAYRTLASIIDGPTVRVDLAPGVRSYRFACSNGSFGYVVWTADDARRRVTIANLTPTVRRTKLLGGRAKVATADGKLTVVASPDPLYIESV